MHNDTNVNLRKDGLCGVVPVYPHEDVTLNGVGLSGYRIVFPSNATGFEKTVAEMLSARIFDISGDRLSWENDEASAEALEILLGKTNRASKIPSQTGALIVAEGSKLILLGKTAYELGLAAKAFLKAVDASVIRGDGKVIFSGVTEIPACREISLMSYNFYGFHAYQSRMDNICRVITKYLPDVLSIQEPDLAMMELTHVNLDGYYDYYNGCPRHGEEGSEPLPDAKGANSVAPILYNRERFRLLSADTKWMSDTPDVPSKFESSAYYRHFSYVELFDRVTEQRFVAVNLHLQGALSLLQVKVVMKYLDRLYRDVPVFLIGDFNNRAENPLFQMLFGEGGFASSHNTAKRIIDGHNRIDWILYTKDCVTAQLYHCCTETYPDPDDRKGYYDGKTPSDHFAYYAEMELSENVKISHDWSALQSWEPLIEEPRA